MIRRMDLTERARLHRALGDETRLRIVDELLLDDRTPHDLGEAVGLPSNLVAHHLRVLEDCGLLLRHDGEGDRRRRYMSLEPGRLDGLLPGAWLRAESVLFVCTHNSARSQFAEAVLRDRFEVEVQSAGSTPSAAVHPKAVSAAAEMGVELATGRPKGYDEVRGLPDLVISVCDRAREAPMPFAGKHLHWSVPDPVDGGGIDSFRTAFSLIDKRVDRLARSLRGATTS
jgi:ArsR family transcriptional regulator, arsenate/arsenite/antimonite-responsive transcriptional repressor / arsenate reductase (thioredoxin)